MIIEFEFELTMSNSLSYSSLAYQQYPTELSMLEREIEINGTTIQIKQDLSLSHAGTVWDGAIVLASYFKKNKQIAFDYIAGKSVLEVGAGTGFLGLACATFRPATVILTDLSQFLSILHSNIQLNKLKYPSTTQVIAKQLSWGNYEHIQAIGKADTIVGSELAYDKHSISLLIETLSAFLKQSVFYIEKMNNSKLYSVIKSMQTNIQIQLLDCPSSFLVASLSRWLGVPWMKTTETNISGFCIQLDDLCSKQELIVFYEYLCETDFTSIYVRLHTIKTSFDSMTKYTLNKAISSYCSPFTLQTMTIDEYEQQSGLN